jgi:hypothetical protein
MISTHSVGGGAAFPAPPPPGGGSLFIPDCFLPFQNMLTFFCQITPRAMPAAVLVNVAISRLFWCKLKLDNFGA